MITITRFNRTRTARVESKMETCVHCTSTPSPIAFLRVSPRWHASPAAPQPRMGDEGDTTAAVPTTEQVAQPVDEHTPALGVLAPEASPAASAGTAAESAGPTASALRPAGNETLFVPPPANVEHRTKRVRCFDREVIIALQNENGPCPLLAIANALALAGKLVLPQTGAPRVAQSELLTLVAAALLEAGDEGAADANKAQNVSDALTLVPKLATGIDVNVRFTGADAFEFTSDICVFDALRLPLYHGWLVDPASEAAALVAPLSYNALVDVVVDDSTPLERRAQLQEFLEATASQLTETGLAALHALPASSLGVLFRNNHFATCYVHQVPATGERLFCLLVTDEGYRDQAELVWESLSDTRGDTPFLGGDFQPFQAPSSAVGVPAQPSAMEGVTDNEALVLRQLQFEEDIETARLLSEQENQAVRATAVARPAQGSQYSGADIGAAIAGAAVDEGVEADSARALAYSRPLFAAVESGDSDAVAVALASGADINARDVTGRSALHWAAGDRRDEIVELLLANGASCNRADDCGYTPLHLAAAAGHESTCRILLNAGADASATEAATRSTPANLAAAANHSAVMALLQSHPKALAAAQRSHARAVQAELSGGSRGQNTSRGRAAASSEQQDTTPEWLRPIVRLFKPS